MIITQIYSHYKIPQNLQEHMFRVAAIGFLVCEAIKKIKIDKNLVVRALLLHDLGNIAKFKFDEEKNSFLSSEDLSRVGDLKKLQVEVINKYSANAEETTFMMMEELKVDLNIIELCRSAAYYAIDEIPTEFSWEQKVYYYSDMRVGPRGVLSVDERFDDLELRYPSEVTRLKLLRTIALEFEKQFQNLSQVDVARFDDEAVEKVIESELTHFDIPTK
jgi:hypothetical protein